jgi:maltose alpha-D-glucosyltransferase/alpha-amylase
MDITSARALVQFLAGPGLSALAQFLARQRWFAAKARAIDSVLVEDWAALRETPPMLLTLLKVDGDRYYVPLAVSASPPDDARVRVAQLGQQTLYDAHWEPEFGRLLLSGIGGGECFAGGRGRFSCRAMGPPLPDAGEMPVHPLSAEQSNTSVLFDRVLIMKSIRRPQPGINPDFEITHFLTRRTTFPHVARLAGWIDYADQDGQAATIAVLQRFVENAGDGWDYVLGGLRRFCESLERENAAGDASGAAAERSVGAIAGGLIGELQSLGRVTGELHAALASDTSLSNFAPEAVMEADIRRWSEGIARDLERAGSELSAARPCLAGEIDRVRPLERARGHHEFLTETLRLLVEGQTAKIRCHGDYHLGQVLKTADAFLVIDFEGEPARPLAERRGKHCPLRDVAGMLRSLNYAVHAVAREREGSGRPPLLAGLERWEDLARRAFLDGYVAAASRSPVRLVPPAVEQTARVCGVFELEKACYELHYELNNRPDWLAIPLAGIRRYLGPLRSSG